MLQVQNKWDFKFVPVLSKGVNLDDDPSIIAEEALTIGENINYQEGIIGPANGYRTFLSTVRGNPRKKIQYNDLSGSTRLVLITNDTAYEKINNTWYYIGEIVTELSANALSGATSLSVTDSTGFTVGEHIGIQLDDGTQHQTTIATVPDGTTITIDVGLASAASTANDVVEAVALSGLDEEYVDYVVMTSQNWLVFTNGVDIVKRFDGTTIEDVPNLPSSGNVVCKLVALVGNYLCLMKTIEGGNDRLHRVRYSDTGDPTNWSTGNAGFTDLIDTEDLITATEPLGPYQIVYKGSSIIRMQLVETTDKVFQFDNMVSGEGAISPGAVAVEDDRHTFVGNFNIYQYVGGQDVHPVGDELFQTYFSAGSSLNRERKERIFARYLGALNEVWIALVVANDDYPKEVLRYDLEKPRWLIRKLPHGIVDAMIYSEFTITTYNDLAGTTYNDLAGNSYNSFAAGGGNQSILFSSPDASKQVFEFDRTLVQDNGVSMTHDAATRDFGHPFFRSRLDSIDIVGKSSTNVLVQISTDRGFSWTQIGTFNTSNNWAQKRFYFQVMFDFIRVRLTATSDGAFLWKGFGLVYKLDTPH